MKTTEKKDLQTKTVNELRKLVKEAQITLSGLRLDKGQNKLNNTSSLSFERKKIAVMLTILNEKIRNEEVVSESSVQEASKEVKSVAKAEDSKKGIADKGGKKNG